MWRGFSFNGTLPRSRFIGPILGLLLTPHLIVAVALMALHRPVPWSSPEFWIMPLRWTFGENVLYGIPNSHLPPSVAPPLFLGTAVATLIGSWLIAALAAKRANAAGLSGWWAFCAITPLVQAPVLLWLAIAPSRPGRESPRAEQPPGGHAVLQGLLAGVGLVLFTVILAALVFRTYGYGLFLVSPVAIGITTAYLANRRQTRTYGATLKIMSLALALGGLGLIICALEGAVCLVLAAPIAWVMGAFGAAIGHTMAQRGRGHPMAGIVLIPLAMAPEQLIAPVIPFSDSMSVEVAASPMTVWQSVLHMQTIAARPSAPFRLGVAYPIRGEVIGEGVGAVRVGTFSTGDAVEHVTEWNPGHALGFDIVSEPPTLRELSPYKHVHAPHVEGYFKSKHARIILEEIAPGRTRLTLATTHELDLEPDFYWLPVARWVVRQNKTRVLGQMKQQSEGDAARAHSPPPR